MGLLPALKAAGTARVVSLSSIGHRRSGMHFEDLNFRTRPYEPFTGYGQSKTANALFAVGLTQRYAADGITANAVMPGGILTGLQKHMTREEQMALGWIRRIGHAESAIQEHRSRAQRHRSGRRSHRSLRASAGSYLEDCAIAEPWTEERPMSGYMPYALDPADARRLWAVSEEVVGG